MQDARERAAREKEKGSRHPPLMCATCWLFPARGVFCGSCSMCICVYTYMCIPAVFLCQAGVSVVLRKSFGSLLWPWSLPCAFVCVFECGAFTARFFFVVASLCLKSPECRDVLRLHPSPSTAALLRLAGLRGQKRRRMHGKLAACTVHRCAGSSIYALLLTIVLWGLCLAL